MYKSKISKQLTTALVAVYFFDTVVFCFTRESVASNVAFGTLSALVGANLFLYAFSRALELFKTNTRPRQTFARRIARILFHASMLLAMAGGVVTAFSRESSMSRISEGYYSSLEKHRKGIKANSCLFVNMRQAMKQPDKNYYELLGGMTGLSYDRNNLLSAYTNVTIYAGGVESRGFMLTYNAPASLDGGKLFFKEAGYAAVVYHKDSITGKTEKMLLMFEREKDGIGFETVSFTRPETGYGMTMEFVPNTMDKDSLEIRDPKLKLKVMSGGTTMFEGDLPKGAELEMGRYTLFFEKVENWADLIYVTDKGVGLVYAGFAGVTFSAFTLMWIVICGGKTKGKAAPLAPSGESAE